MTTYTCPICGYFTSFGYPARIQLYYTVSHSGGVAIEAILDRLESAYGITESKGK